MEERYMYYSKDEVSAAEIACAIMLAVLHDVRVNDLSLPGLPQILVDALAGVSFDHSPLFKDTDLDNDHCITTYEIYSMIDIFFEGKTTYSVKQIYRLIDFYFEQDC